MKPDWDKLMADFAGSDTQLVADVDCTDAEGGGDKLCEEHGIQGFPTIKYGDPSDLQDYQGGRDYDSLKSFADENLKPMCSPKNIDLCDDAKKAEIKKYQAMSAEELQKAIEEQEGKIEEAEMTFKTELEKLQNTFQEISATKDETIAEIKASGLGLMKSVKAFMAASAGTDKAEL